MSRYYMAYGMMQRGPFPMTDLVGQGVRPETLVWKEGMDQWRRADEVEELIFAGIVTPPLPQSAAAMAPHPVPIAPPYNPPSSNRIAAGVCGILLGSFGVHKFILGRVGAGVIMLLATLLSCGWLGIVAHVIGIIEGILYLTKTDEQFHQEYVVGKKAWF